MYRVIVVDDNPLAVEGICQNLAGSAPEVEVRGTYHDAFSALEALEGAVETDIVISDIRMPGMDGLELSRRILESHSQVKIILISAYDDFEYAKQALRMGAFDYVEKPIDYPYLLEVVRKAVARLEQDRRNLEQLRHSLPALKDNFFRELLLVGGEEARFRLGSYLPFLGVNLDWRYFNCSVVSIENAPERKAQLGVELYHARLMALQEDIRRNLEDFPLVHLLVELERVYVVTATSWPDSGVVVRRLNEAFSSILEEAPNRGFRLNIGIGEVVSGVWKLSHSGKTAKNALEYRHFFPQKSLFDYRDAGVRQQAGDYIDPQLEEDLIAAVCKRDMEGIREAAEEFAGCFVGRYADKGTVFYAVYSLLGAVQKLLEEMGIPARNVQREIIGGMNRPDSMTSPHRIGELITQVCGAAAREIGQSADSNYRQICRAVNEYIESRYGDSALSLAEIAAHVNVSPAHLSAVYKKTLDKNISDVILHTRLQAAKLLLEAGALSVREISERTGYSNQYYFSANFKKHVGLTPTEYRNARRPEQEKALPNPANN